jgi:nicotinate dehydrogenase subunit A
MLARLYANGILVTGLNRDVLQACRRAGTIRMTQPTIRLSVNGRIHDVDAAPDTALLYVLRNDLELNGPKYGCGLGECGACAVLIDGVAARSCVIPISGCVGRDIVTLEGLGSRDHPDPVQDAFIREQAAQCGYCLNGMIMSTKALLLRKLHIEIMRAAMRAAGHLAEAQD